MSNIIIPKWSIGDITTGQVHHDFIRWISSIDMQNKQYEYIFNFQYLTNAYIDDFDYITILYSDIFRELGDNNAV